MLGQRKNEIFVAKKTKPKKATNAQKTHCKNNKKMNVFIKEMGSEWLVTVEDCKTYIPTVYEEVKGMVTLTILNSRQYCVILDPYNKDKQINELGYKKLVKGAKSFFMHPGEKLARGIEDIYVLSENEGLILSANEPFDDDVGERKMTEEEFEQTDDSNEKKDDTNTLNRITSAGTIPRQSGVLYLSLFVCVCVCVCVYE